MGHFELLFQGVLLFIVVLSVIGSFRKKYSSEPINKGHSIVLLAVLAFAPGAIGWFYSINFKAVLMERSSFFILPFLAMLVLSSFREQDKFKAAIGAFLILMIGNWSLSTQREHYFVSQFYKQ